MASVKTIEQILRERFGSLLEEACCFRGELTVRIPSDAIVEVARFLRDHPALRFNYLSDLTAVDYLHLGRALRFDVVYHLLSLEYYHRVRVKAAVPESPGRAPSVVSIWPAAHAHEREVFDLFGIAFDGHPALTRILMPDDWEGHPLRKDFPIGGARSFYFKRDSQPRAGEPPGLVPRIRRNESDV